MPDYKSMYFKLAGKIADVIDLLIEAQRQGEESFISAETEPIIEVLHLQKDRNDKPPPD